jgi:glutamyl-tRNA reductase
MVGVAHHDASLAQLERTAVASSERAKVQAQVLATGCAEVLVLSTCSRTELHTVLDIDLSDDTQGHEACRAIANRLVAILVDRSDLRTRPAALIGEDAVRQLFRVAAGLDSRIIGEVEVQGQLRAAARVATAARGEPHRLRRLVAAACAAARATTATEPALRRSGLLAQRAVTCALAENDDPRPGRALVVGAGTMGRQVADRLGTVGCHATLLSRTPGRAPNRGPSAHPLEGLPWRLASADLVFVATSAGRLLLPAARVQAVLERRRERRLTIVDLSLPRNVDRAVAHLEGVRLLDLDDLADRACGAHPPPELVASAEAATSAAAKAYCAEVRSRRAGPLITAMRSQIEDVCLQQLRRTTRAVGLPEEALLRTASAIAGAVAHRPTLLARQAAADDDVATIASLAAAFGLNDPATSGTVAQPRPATIDALAMTTPDSRPQGVPVAGLAERVRSSTARRDAAEVRAPTTDRRHPAQGR